jgi:hypothetical protein
MKLCSTRVLVWLSLVMASVAVIDYPVADPPIPRALPAESPAITADFVADTESDETMLASGGLPELTALRGDPEVGQRWERELRQLKALSDREPRAAFARIAEMAEKEEREAALLEVCVYLSASDPAFAMQAGWELGLGELGGRVEMTALATLGSKWAVADPEAALAWACALPRDEMGRRDRVIKGIVAARCQSSPAEAAELIAEHMSPNQTQFVSAMRVVKQWAQTDYWAAADWVALFPDGPVREQGQEELSKVQRQFQSATP